jgi:hypothetical protein
VITLQKAMFEILFQTLHNDDPYRPQNEIAAGRWGTELQSTTSQQAAEN